MPDCENCRASVDRLCLVSNGKRVCCPACVYNPLGCRCKFGELGVPEAQDWSDPDDGWDAAEDGGDALDEALADCKMGRSGYCGAAGSEYCDFECPFRP